MSNTEFLQDIINLGREDVLEHTEEEGCTNCQYRRILAVVADDVLRAEEHTGDPKALAARLMMETTDRMLRWCHARRESEREKQRESGTETDR